MRCTRCGKFVDEQYDVVTEDYAYCEACEASFQAAMAQEYPFGQCYECGAAYQEATCEQGKVHTFAMHSEGGCSKWGDVADRPWSVEDFAAGYCSFGCRPAPRPRPVAVASLDDLPF
jgi:hypothetical protein